MSLITCPECGKAVSSEAATCPSCGRPIKPPPIPANKTGLWWGLGCLLAVPAFLTIIAIVGLLAAIAIPSFIKSRSTFHLHACMINLQQIESAKRSWALAYNANSGAEVDVAGVNEMLKPGTMSGCPAGGTYIYHRVGIPPECSVHGVLGQAQARPPGTSSRTGARDGVPATHDP